jgi:hypothetical protein
LAEPLNGEDGPGSADEFDSQDRDREGEERTVAWKLAETSRERNHEVSFVP